MQASVAQQRQSVAIQAHALAKAGGPVIVPGIAPLPCPAVPAPELDSFIQSAARDQQLDASLIREVARQESSFRPCAVSSKGAEGLMQLMPGTQMQLQVRNPFDAKSSIDAGAKLLKQLLDRYHGNLSLALSAYNAGPARVDQTESIPAIPETESYVTRILQRLGYAPADSEPARAASDQ